jgi:hypothetical protein
MQIVELISEERLETYEKIALGRKQAIALHSQTLQLGSSLMAAIALFELALRNATNKHLIDAFGDSDWLLPEKTAVPLQKFERAKVSAAQSRFQALRLPKFREKVASGPDEQHCGSLMAKLSLKRRCSSGNVCIHQITKTRFGNPL